VKDLIGSNSAGDAGEAGTAAIARNSRDGRRWAREVLRRGILELLYVCSNLAIAGGVLLWLYRLVTHKAALQTGLFLAAAVGVSLLAYHFARWRASAAISRQVERLTAWLIATLGLALVWGGICFAFTFGALRWIGAPGMLSWIIAGTAGLCGFVYMVAGEWNELGDCLALPAAANQTGQSVESTA
jgi:hypothetical protein